MSFDAPAASPSGQPERAAHGGDRTALTLGELLADPELSLTLLARGTAGIDQPVNAAVALDLCAERDLDTALRPGVIVLAARYLAELDVKDQRELITRLGSHGVAALGIATGDARQPVPSAVVERAAAEGLTVFSLPPETSCARLMEHCATLLAAHHEGSTSVALHDYLMDAVRERDPMDAVVRRLGHLVGGAALLFNDGGHLVTATGGPGMPEATEIWDALGTRPATLQQFDIGVCHVTSVPIRAAGSVRYWLAGVTRRELAGGQSWRLMFRTAERLLELIGLVRESAAADERALRAALLETALKDRDPGRLLEASHRAARFGLTFEQPCRVIVARSPAGSKHHGAAGTPSIERLAEQLRAALAEQHVPGLVDEQAGTIFALVQNEGVAIDRWVTALAREGVDVVAGLGRRHSSIDLTRDSWHDAQLALHQIERRASGVLRIEQSDLSRWLLGGIAPHQLAPKVRALIEPIKAQPRLYETLIAYLDADLDLHAAAATLHLHVNSVRYRLAKVERVLGRELNRTATLADVYLAVTADRSALLVDAP